MAKSEKLAAYFKLYTEHHLNHVNKAIHWICVPLIMFSILGLCWVLPFPTALSYYGTFNWASILMAMVVWYWYQLSPALSYAMILVIAGMCYLVVQLNAFFIGAPVHYWVIYLGIFFLAWIGQFIGHKIEGKKPSFLEDLRFLLIGPLWLVQFVFTRLKISY